MDTDLKKQPSITVSIGQDVGSTADLYIDSNEENEVSNATPLAKEIPLQKEVFRTINPIVFDGNSPAFLKVDTGGSVIVSSQITVPFSFSYLATKIDSQKRSVSVIIFDPIGVIEAAAGDADYFKSLVLAVAYFEYFARRYLSKKLQGKIDLDRLDRFSVEELIILLKALDMIPEDIFSKAFEVIRKRNEMVHRDITSQFVIGQADGESLVQKAIDCVKALTKEDQAISFPKVEPK